MDVVPSMKTLQGARTNYRRGMTRPHVFRLISKGCRLSTAVGCDLAFPAQ